MDEACVRAGSRRGLKVWDIPKKLSSRSVHGESLQTQRQRTTAGPLCAAHCPLLPSQSWAGAAASQASALSLFLLAHCSGLDPWIQAADVHVPSDYTGTRRGLSRHCLLQCSGPTQHADPHCCLFLFYFFNSVSSQQQRTP